MNVIKCLGSAEKHSQVKFCVIGALYALDGVTKWLQVKIEASGVICGTDIGGMGLTDGSGRFESWAGLIRGAEMGSRCGKGIRKLEMEVVGLRVFVVEIKGVWPGRPGSWTNVTGLTMCVSCTKLLAGCLLVIGKCVEIGRSGCARKIHNSSSIALILL